MINNQQKPNIIILFSGVVIIISGLKMASAIVTPLLLSAFLALICSPIVNKLESSKVPRTIASLMTVILLCYGVVVIGDILAASSKTFFLDMQNAVETLAEKWSELNGENENFILSQLEALNVGSVLSSGLSVLSTIKSTISFTFITVLTTFLFLCEGREWHFKIQQLLGNSRFSESVSREIKAYLTVKVGASLLTGTIISLVLLGLGHEYWLLWGLLATALNFIPNIGSILASIPAIAVSAATMDILYVVLTIATYAGVNVLVGSYLEPKVIGNKLGLSTLVVFLSMIFFGWMFGIIGMLLSVPIISCIKIIFDEVEPKLSLLLK